ncbi:MAG: amidase family protein, partial [Burkholderiales bacterium]
MSAIHDLSAAELAEQYRSGSLSPVEAAAAQLDRIEAWEPKLNAMYRLDRDDALAKARAAEARWRAGMPLSGLDGVPVTIKENIATRGDPAPI